MIPFETKEGLSGHCCVFFGNLTNPDITFPKEEVSRQILANKNFDNRTRPNQNKEQEKPKNDSGKMEFTERNYNYGNKRKEIIKDHAEQEPENPENITIKNKNAFDTPTVCPEGTMKDHGGDCQEPF
ncbi:hypothetical protein BDFB_003247 [Asbolus verrucosus]|uniref:Uncharacterized protein n=1 Tax=Asbolus verrucosus TaxID=1661398 RepID=A0A482V9D2_ASBVE|nr:hypothetical protein BDFB_003247 [Asbolus verrucosus]